MKALTRVTKVWKRYMPGCQNLRTCETWLPKLLSKFQIPSTLVPKVINAHSITKLINLSCLHCFREKPLGGNKVRRIWNWSKILCQRNQEILKVSKNHHNSWKALQLKYLQLVRICWGHSASCFSYDFAFKVISKKILWSKDFTGKDLTIIFPTNLVRFYSFGFFSQKPKTRINFSARWINFSLLTKNISVFLFTANRFLL